MNRNVAKSHQQPTRTSIQMNVVSVTSLVAIVLFFGEVLLLDGCDSGVDTADAGTADVGRPDSGATDTGDTDTSGSGRPLASDSGISDVGDTGLEDAAPSPGDEMYAPVPLTFPAYDPSNPEMMLIDEDEDWAAINRPDKRFFFVTPGDYSSYSVSHPDEGYIQLETSGTEERPRYLIYYDPADPDNDTHPANMPESQRAILKFFRLFGASHWVLDRLTVRGSPYANRIIGRGDKDREDTSSDGFPLENGTSGSFSPSSYNILNRMLFEDTENSMLQIFEGCDHNTIQNSVFRMTTREITDDHIGVFLQAWKGVAGRATIFGTRIVANEFINLNDGIALFDTEILPGTPSYPITVIADNDIYVTPFFYTNGNGVFDTKGTFAPTENALDIKSASIDPNNWVHIVNNRMWGFRDMDLNLEHRGSQANGEAIVIHHGSGSESYSVGYMIIKGNIIMDCQSGIILQQQQHISINENIFFDINDKTENDEAIWAALFIGGNHHEIYKNAIINTDYWLWAPSDANESSDWDLRCNVIVNSGGFEYTAPEENVMADYNFYYNVTHLRHPDTSSVLEAPGTHDITMPNAADSSNSEYCFERRRITSPEVICIPYVTTEPTSPHYNKCDDTLGTRPDMGVD